MNFIVITTIYPPTEAINIFSKMSNFKLVVVGDKKTPSDWQCENTTYISLEAQKKLGYELSKMLPYNHYCRKMIGYLNAISNDAEVIIDTDDDNIPKTNWGFPAFEGSYSSIPENRGFVNTYALFSEQTIWPRGLPLKYIKKSIDYINGLETHEKRINIGIWQGLADKNPDVDAIYRLTSDEECFFKDSTPIALGKGSISPFNTQNTAIRKELFPLLYLPTSVTFRFTDILRGYVAQPIMWLYDYHLGFTNATVVQERNPHDYFKDFESEIPMYLNAEKAIEIVNSSISKNFGIIDNLYNAYTNLAKGKIVDEKEMYTLSAWLEDLNSAYLP
jgi:hypothetical protein